MTNFEMENLELTQATFVIVHHEAEDYHNLVLESDNTNNSTSELLLESLLEKYSGAWKKLADL